MWNLCCFFQYFDGIPFKSRDLSHILLQYQTILGFLCLTNHIYSMFHRLLHGFLQLLENIRNIHVIFCKLAINNYPFHQIVLPKVIDPKLLQRVRRTVRYGSNYYVAIHIFTKLSADDSIWFILVSRHCIYWFAIVELVCGSGYVRQYDIDYGNYLHEVDDRAEDVEDIEKMMDIK